MPFNTFSTRLAQKPSQGFTLVEIMIVIVILTIFAGMVGLAVGGSEKRRQLQYYDRLIDDLKLAKLESVDSMRVMGFVVQPANATQEATYALVQLSDDAQQRIYQPFGANNGSEQPNISKPANNRLGPGLSGMDAVFKLDGDSSEAQGPLWQASSAFEETTLLPTMRIEVVSMNPNATAQINTQAGIQPDNLNPLFTESADLPSVLWFGNGEATPVRIQLFAGEAELGEPIFVDALGRVSQNSLEAGL